MKGSFNKIKKFKYLKMGLTKMDKKAVVVEDLVKWIAAIIALIIVLAILLYILSPTFRQLFDNLFLATTYSSGRGGG